MTWQQAAAIIQARAAATFGEAVDADQLDAMNAWLAEVNFPYSREMTFVVIQEPLSICLMKKGADYAEG